MPKKKPIATCYSNEDIALLGIEYVNTKEQIKSLDKHCKDDLRPILENALETSGRTTESGSVLAVVTHGDMDVHITNTLRTGKVLLPEAMDVLKENGLEECIETVEVIREDVLERLYDEGKVSNEVLKKLYRETSNYAFGVKLKKHYEV